MPTSEATARFFSEYERLRPDQQEQFKAALREFVSVLRAMERVSFRGIPRFPAHLGVKPMVNHRSIMEFAWAPDGRATWEYGPPIRSGMYHIRCRRIGTHAIYDDP
ncbi:MAG TPA: hypothetical protein VFA70_07455 [Dehalococcoidia bacterium]|jgi:hypothetical protein|nr:hypothetical protein [Dehalococcoidia bacterium]